MYALPWFPWPIYSKASSQVCSQRLVRAKACAHKSRKSISSCKRSARRPPMVLRCPITPQWLPHIRLRSDLLTRNNSNNRLWDMQSTGTRCRRVQTNFKRLKMLLGHGPGRSSPKVTHRTRTTLKGLAVERPGPDSGTNNEISRRLSSTTPNSECCETFDLRWRTTV